MDLVCISFMSESALSIIKLLSLNFGHNCLFLKLFHCLCGQESRKRKTHFSFAQSFQKKLCKP